jgi:putative ABC transport system permease protein
MIRPRDHLKEGLHAILRHKLRSALTLLGVVFGIAAVITMLGIGTGAQRTVLSEISGMGLRNILVESAKPEIRKRVSSTTRSHRSRLNYGLTFRDADQVERSLPAGCLVERVHQAGQPVTLLGKKSSAVVLGVSPEWFEVMMARRLDGVLLGDLQAQGVHPVAVVNPAFLEANPLPDGGLGRMVRIGSSYLEICGVAEIPAYASRPHVFLPYETARQILGGVQANFEAGSTEFTYTELGRMVVQVADEEMVAGVSEMIREQLTRTHPDGDFAITVPLELLRSKMRTQRVLNLVLVSIAAISLLVGGIGIMNIMLASVSERVPEIGIRRAVGARRADIVAQFLFETATLTLLGGVIGVALGYAAVPLAGAFMGWQGIITPSAVFLSLGVALATGLLFGIAPAVRAARLDPAEALRRG